MGSSCPVAVLLFPYIISYLDCWLSGPFFFRPIGVHFEKYRWVGEGALLICFDGDFECFLTS